MQSGTVDGLYYEVHGGPLSEEWAADRETVILSAGLGGSGAFWAPQMEALLSRFRVVLYDHRGTGRSVRALTDPHTVAVMGDDIVKVMDALGLDRAHVDDVVVLVEGQGAGDVDDPVGQGSGRERGDGLARAGRGDDGLGHEFSSIFVIAVEDPLRPSGPPPPEGEDLGPAPRPLGAPPLGELSRSD